MYYLLECREWQQCSRTGAAVIEEAIDTTKDGKNNATEVVTTVDKEVSSCSVLIYCIHIHCVDMYYLLECRE